MIVNNSLLTTQLGVSTFTARIFQKPMFTVHIIRQLITTNGSLYLKPMYGTLKKKKNETEGERSGKSV